MKIEDPLRVCKCGKKLSALTFLFLACSFHASWRVVVDFSESPPLARGIYPGGQSGNPFSELYDAHLKKFVDFDYYPIDLTVGQ